MPQDYNMNFGAFIGNAQGKMTFPSAYTGDTVTIAAQNGLTFTHATARLVPGATSFSLRNNANNADNVLVSNAGAVTVRAGLTVTASGLTVTAGGITVTDGGFALRGSSRVRESMTLANIVTAGAGTYTAAQLVGGIITRDPTGAGRTDTTATGTEIETELNAQGVAVATDDTFICYVINTADAAETITLQAGAGVTLSNVGQTIAQNESAMLIFQRTAANTYTCHIVGA